MGKIDIQLIVHPDCKITAIDDNSYLTLPGQYSALVESLKDYTSIEFLKYKDQEIARDTLRIEHFNAERGNMLNDTIFPIYKDGTYVYYKMLIPNLEFLFVESATIPNYFSEICLIKQTFYYNGKFYMYIGDSDIVFDQELSKEQILTMYLTDILSHSKVLTYEELFDNLGSQSFFCKKIVFTICNLIKYFVSLQRKTLAKLSSNYCYDDSQNALQKDFILSTIYVLDYLKDINNFAEAQRILDNITECDLIDSKIVSDNCGCYGK